MSGYFKTGPQQYAAGDRFLGIRVPAIRKLARTCHGLSLEDLDCLLKSRWHEERLLALVILVARHRKSSPEDQRTLCRFYLSRTSSINNWDLVDVSAEHIVGAQNGPVPADAEPDRNIVIEGGIWTTLATSRDQWNGNSRGRSAKQGDVPGCHGVILLSNVCGVVVQQLTVRQSRAFGVHLSNCREFLVEDMRFEDHGRDGVHVNGPTAYGVIRHVRGVTHDDFVALNAWEWMGYTPTFGPIQHVLVEDVSGTDRALGDYASPYPDGTAEIRLLPGTKVFPGGTRLACDIGDCVFRNLVNIRTVKMYDQPNLELGRDKDFADPIGTIRNVYFSRLIFERPGRFQIAANVDSLTIDDVQFRFVPPDAFKLVEIGPMSATYKHRPDDPATWTEIFSPERDVTVRAFRLTGVRVLQGGQLVSLPEASTRLVQVADQQPNPDYPKITPRGGSGKARILP